MPKPKLLQWLLIGSVALVAGLVALYFVANVFIREITQEVQIPVRFQAALPAEVSAPAPYWELPNLQGGSSSLSDFAGTPLVITFWTTWNAMAVDQLAILDEYLSSETRPLFEIVAINSQEDENVVSNFARRGEYKLRILLDETGEVGELYGITALPVTYFVDRNGVIQDVRVGTLSRGQLVEKAQAIIR